MSCFRITVCDFRSSEESDKGFGCGSSHLLPRSSVAGHRSAMTVVVTLSPLTLEQGNHVCDNIVPYLC